MLASQKATLPPDKQKTNTATNLHVAEPIAAATTELT